MSIRAVNDMTFRENISKKGVTLVDFGTPYCPPCRTLLPILEDLDREFGGKLRIVKVDCTESPGSASAYGVQSTPTVIVFHNGVPVEKLVGLQSKASYRSIASRYLKQA